MDRKWDGDILMQVFIYTITNKINMKQYVGITRNMLKRWGEHKLPYNNKTSMGKAIQKYGHQNFEMVQIASSTSWENAQLVERALIKQLNTRVPNGYNLTDGGDGTLGFKHTAEECQRRSERCPTRNPEVMKLIADKQRGVKRPQTSGEKNALFGRTGSKSHMTKHIVIATNMATQEQKTLIGAKAIKEAGFNRAHVYSCANKQRKTHKHHTFEFQGETI